MGAAHVHFRHGHERDAYHAAMVVVPRPCNLDTLPASPHRGWALHGVPHLARKKDNWTGICALGAGTVRRPELRVERLRSGQPVVRVDGHCGDDGEQHAE